MKYVFSLSAMTRSPEPATSTTEDSRTFFIEQHDPLVDHNFHINVSQRKLKRKLDEVTAALVECKQLVKVSGQKVSRLHKNLTLSGILLIVYRMNSA